MRSPVSRRRSIFGRADEWRERDLHEYYLVADIAPFQAKGLVLPTVKRALKLCGARVNPVSATPRGP